MTDWTDGAFVLSDSAVSNAGFRPSRLRRRDYFRDEAVVSIDDWSAIALDDERAYRRTLASPRMRWSTRPSGSPGQRSHPRRLGAECRRTPTRLRATGSEAGPLPFSRQRPVQ